MWTWFGANNADEDSALAGKGGDAGSADCAEAPGFASASNSPCNGDMDNGGSSNFLDSLESPLASPTYMSCMRNQSMMSPEPSFSCRSSIIHSRRQKPTEADPAPQSIKCATNLFGEPDWVEISDRLRDSLVISDTPVRKRRKKGSQFPRNPQKGCGTSIQRRFQIPRPVLTSRRRVPLRGETVAQWRAKCKKNGVRPTFEAVRAPQDENSDRDRGIGSERTQARDKGGGCRSILEDEATTHDFQRHGTHQSDLSTQCGEPSCEQHQSKRRKTSSCSIEPAAELINSEADEQEGSDSLRKGEDHCATETTCLTKTSLIPTPSNTSDILRESNPPWTFDGTGEEPVVANWSHSGQGGDWGRNATKQSSTTEPILPIRMGDLQARCRSQGVRHQTCLDTRPSPSVYTPIPPKTPSPMTHQIPIAPTSGMKGDFGERGRSPSRHGIPPLRLSDGLERRDLSPGLISPKAHVKNNISCVPPRELAHVRKEFCPPRVNETFPHFHLESSREREVSTFRTDFAPSRMAQCRPPPSSCSNGRPDVRDMVGVESGGDMKRDCYREERMNFDLTGGNRRDISGGQHFSPQGHYGDADNSGCLGVSEIKLCADFSPIFIRLRSSRSASPAYNPRRGNTAGGPSQSTRPAVPSYHRAGSPSNPYGGGARNEKNVNTCCFGEPPKLPNSDASFPPEASSHQRSPPSPSTRLHNLSAPLAHFRSTVSLMKEATRRSPSPFRSGDPRPQYTRGPYCASHDWSDLDNLKREVHPNELGELTRPHPSVAGIQPRDIFQRHEGQSTIYLNSNVPTTEIQYECQTASLQYEQPQSNQNSSHIFPKSDAASSPYQDPRQGTEMRSEPDPNLSPDISQNSFLTQNSQLDQSTLLHPGQIAPHSFPDNQSLAHHTMNCAASPSSNICQPPETPQSKMNIGDSPQSADEIPGGTTEFNYYNQHQTAEFFGDGRPDDHWRSYPSTCGPPHEPSSNSGPQGSENPSNERYCGMDSREGHVVGSIGAYSGCAGLNVSTETYASTVTYTGCNHMPHLHSEDPREHTTNEFTQLRDTFKRSATEPLRTNETDFNQNYFRESRFPNLTNLLSHGFPGVHEDLIHY